MKIGLVAFTDRGMELGRRLAQGLEAQGELWTEAAKAASRWPIGPTPIFSTVRR